MKDAGAARVIMLDSLTLIEQAIACSVSGSRNRTPAGYLSLERLCAWQ